MEKAQETALARFGIDPDQIIHEDGRYWMTAELLGKALGYRQPRKGIMKLVERHRKELQPFTCVVSLTTQAGPRETTVFDTDGQYRIALLANTPKAEKFRTFIVNMLKALERSEFIHISQVMQWRKDLINLGVHKALSTSRVMDEDKYDRMIRYRSLGLTQKETAKLLDVSKDMIKKMEAIPRKYELKALDGGAR